MRLTQLGTEAASTEFEYQDREKDILTQLRVEHLNMEERKLLIEACSNYQDIFYLPGDKLSSTGTAQHSTSVEPGTEPILDSTDYQKHKRWKYISK